MQIQDKYFFQERVKLLLKILKLLMIVIGTMGVIRLMEKDYIQTLIDLLFFVTVLFGYFQLKTNSERYISITRVVFFAALVTSILLFFNQPDNPIRFIWFTTTVYMIFYLFEQNEATYWVSTISIVLMILFFFLKESFHLSIIDFLIWLMNMVIILMISHWYAKIEKESREELLKMKDLLSDKVHIKTQELEKKTIELKLLNQDLEKRITEKTAENRRQEKMFFQQARYAQMGEMISMIAHQWRQPLNAIAATSATVRLQLERGNIDNTLLKTKAEAVGKHVQYLSSTIDDFRNFFKLDKVKKQIKFSTVIDDALMLAESALKYNNIEVVKEYQCISCNIYTYPNEILHVILNLVKNAEDALLSQGISEPKIIISTFKKEGHLAFEIKDNAGGIDESLIDNILDPYFTTKEDNGGTGLGLYMSRIIIEEHCGGTIEVENGKEGAIFRLLFPIVQEEDENFS